MGFAQPIECVVLEDFPLCPLGSGCSLAVADEQDQLAVRDRAKHALDECCAHETGGPGDGNSFACKGFSNHRCCSSMILYQLVERAAKMM